MPETNAPTILDRVAAAERWAHEAADGDSNDDHIAALDDLCCALAELAGYTLTLDIG